MTVLEMTGHNDCTELEIIGQNDRTGNGRINDCTVNDGQNDRTGNGRTK